MSIIFNEEEHSYRSSDPNESIIWISVTTLISQFKKPFNSKAIAKRVSKNKRSKWYGITPKKIEKIWKDEANRATSLGTFYHNQREDDLCSLASLEREGHNLPVFAPIKQENGTKLASLQRLEPGVYPEHMVYLKSAGICGQSDLVEVIDNKVNIIDYKTNKEIKTKSYVDWEGISQRLSSPVSHIEDCNFYHYALQLSIYMYIIIKHNSKLKPGKILIHHVRFEHTGVDDHGYPIIKYLDNGDPVIKEILKIPVPYLKSEVISIVNWLHDNKHKIKTN